MTKVYGPQCPICGFDIDPTDVPWTVASNYVEFECPGCEEMIWMEYEHVYTTGTIRKDSDPTNAREDS